MADREGEAISLEVVKQRFLDAESALSDLLDTLQSLVAAQESAEKASEALAEAAKSMGAYTAAAERLTTELQRTQEQVTAAAKAASDSLSGEAISSLHEEVQALAQRMEASQAEYVAQVNGLSENLLTRIGGLEAKFAQLSQHRHRLGGAIKTS